MKFPRIDVAYNIVFNNTGLEWIDIQGSICNIVESKYGTLHCITKEYHEELDVGSHYVEIKDTPCSLYFRVRDLQIEVVALRAQFIDADNRKWNVSLPDTIGDRILYQATVNRHSDNHTWVQNMIWDGFIEKWLWCDDELNKPLDETKFTVKAWQPLPKAYVDHQRNDL